ncbi:MAG: serine hydrolase domain-containing protein [Blautia sp.]
MSKTVSCLGAGKAIEKGLYSLDTDILPFFDLNKIVNAKNIPYLKKMKIRHLLNLTIGQDKGLMFSKDIKQLPTDTDFLYYILNYDINHEPGTHFVYNNAATYLLCAITQKITGQYFRDWIQKELFNEMGVTLGEWEKSWQGICLGASGLKLKNSDMHKIALLLLNNGTYEGKRLLNKEWISLMNTPQFLLQIYQIILRSRDVALIKCPMVLVYGYVVMVLSNIPKHIIFAMELMDSF